VKPKLEQQLLKAIRRTAMILPGDRVGVGVSGGADSVALFRLLEALRKDLGITLLILHFDHCLRGEESAADAQFVKSLACQYHVEFISDCADVSAFAKKQRLNLEDAARRLRYAFFESIVAGGRITRAAIAHTADDQAETVLARLLRGTGPSGLAGIYPTLGAVVRPLLDYRREQLREYLCALGQPWREDATNSDISRQRAQIRCQLLPVLERDFSIHIVQRLNDLARLSREEREFWDSLVEDRFRSLSHNKSNGAIAITPADLLSPLPLQQLAAIQSGSAAPAKPLTERLIRRLYKGIRGDYRDLTAKHVEGIFQLAQQGASGQQLDLPGDILVQRSFDELIFSARANPGTPRRTVATNSAAPAYHHTVSVPATGTASVSVPELGTRLLLKVIDWSSRQRDTIPDDALDADLLPRTFTLRNWQPGDAYRPRGRRQRHKLKELFLSRRIPRSQRFSWPVIEADGRIVWSRDMPPAADFCVREGTRVGILILEVPINV
jgi:tRNA(Ile)-lysidine synthase